MRLLLTVIVTVAGILVSFYLTTYLPAVLSTPWLVVASVIYVIMMAYLYSLIWGRQKNN